MRRSKLSKIILTIAAASIFTHSAFVSRSYAASFTFAAAGDHGFSSNFREVIKKVGSFVGSINFFLAVGDLKYGSGTVADWSQAVKDNLNIGASLPAGNSFGQNFPYQIVSGNHDDDDTTTGLIDEFTQSGNLPNRMPNMVMSPHYTGSTGSSYGKEYYFDYLTSGSPLARFIMISPNLNFTATTGGIDYDYLTGDARYNWVRDTIDAARSAGIPWVIVGMHQNCITVGVKSCSIKADIMNLLNSKDALGRQRVDLILQGHDHTYQRSKQLTLKTGCSAIPTGSTDPDCIVDDGADNVYTKGAGTVLVIAGTGGNGLYTINSSDPENGYFAAWMGATSGSESKPPGGNGTWGITKFTISDSPLQLSAQFVRAAGGNYTDSFTITSGPLPTASPGGPTPTPKPTPTPSPKPTATPDIIVASPALQPTPVPSATPGLTLTFTPTDDATILSASPSANYGGATNLQLDASPIEHFVMKFVVTSVNNRTIQNATLRLRNINTSNFGGEFKKAAHNNWSEGTVTWNTAPAGETVLATLGSVVSGTWYDLDLTSLIQGDGTYSLRASSSSNDGAGYNSKESANDPQLVVTLSSSSPPPTGGCPNTVLGDANGDNQVTDADYDIWLTHYNQTVTNGACSGNFNAPTDSLVNGIDYAIWRNNAALPSPAPTVTTASPQLTASPSPGTTGTLMTYPAYGGATYLSTDYEVTLQQGTSPVVSSFASYSFQKSEYPQYDEFGNVIQIFQPNSKHNMVRHSSTIFSFGGSPVTVRVKVRPGTPHITLPLTSCKVLPSSYNIPCTVSGTDTMVFTLTRPVKVFAIANYNKVWDTYVQMGQGHRSISAWREYSTQRLRSDYSDVTKTEISEGYKNPFIVIAHELETTADIPSKTDALVINPGQLVTQTQIDNAQVIWFTPGVHDYSTIGTDPGHQITLKKGQTVYLEGGAYVIARFIRTSSGTGATRVLGRGALSGINLKWVKNRSLCAALLDIDLIKGITLTDRACFGIERVAGSAPTFPMTVADVALIGAWHANTSSIEGRNATMEDSMLIAFDDNLKMLEQFQARRLVIWQGANAHPIMVHENTNRDLTNSIAEDIDIVAYTRTPPNNSDNWSQVSEGAIASVRGGLNSTVSNFTFRNIRIESPYLARAIDLYNLNTNLINPGWFSQTSETSHSKVNGLLFQNITVTSPVIAFESLLGSAYANSFSNVTTQNLVINGVKVTESNKENFFEFEGDLQGVSFPP